MSSPLQINLMPAEWFFPDWLVYLYLSGNPWVCSCSLDYFNEYLKDNEMNIYTRDGLVHSNDAESVVSKTRQERK